LATDEDMAALAGNLIRMEENEVAKVEVTLYRDGTIRIATYPTDSSGVQLMVHGLDMLGYEVALKDRDPLADGSVAMTGIIDRDASIIAMAGDPAEA
jgi:hypothetical protein